MIQLSGLTSCSVMSVKPSFHYPSWRPQWPVSITLQQGPCWWERVSTSRVDGPSTRLVETRAHQHGPCWRVMETGHPSTRAINLGSGNRALMSRFTHLTARHAHVYSATLSGKFDWKAFLTQPITHIGDSENWTWISLVRINHLSHCSSFHGCSFLYCDTEQ